MEIRKEFILVLSEEDIDETIYNDKVKGCRFDKVYVPKGYMNTFLDSKLFSLLRGTLYVGGEQRAQILVQR